MKWPSCFICILLPFLVPAQDQPIIGNDYITIVDQVKVYGVTDAGTKDSNFFLLRKGTKFTIISIASDKNLTITPWPYTQKSEQPATAGIVNSYETDKLKSFIAAWANNKQFIIDPTDLNSKCVLYHGRARSFVWGAVTLPLKIRFGNGSDRLFNTEESLNLGLSAGYKWQIPGVHVAAMNWIAFATFGNVTVDSASLNPDENGKPTPPPSSSIAPAVSFGSGLVFQYENSFQIGVFLGFDNATSVLGRSWKFQGHPWIGIGFGVALFSASSTKSPGTNTAPQ